MRMDTIIHSGPASNFIDRSVCCSSNQSFMKKFATVLILMFTAAQLFAGPGGNIADAVHVSGRAVVFFGPTWDEYVALTEEDKKAINAELYDFAHNRLEVLSYLEANGIREINTASQNIQIQIDPDEVITYVRGDFDHAFGLIMTDGQNEPKVVLGAVAVSELKSMFEEYFGLQ